MCRHTRRDAHTTQSDGATTRPGGSIFSRVPVTHRLTTVALRSHFVASDDFVKIDFLAQWAVFSSGIGVFGGNRADFHFRLTDRVICC